MATVEQNNLSFANVSAEWTLLTNLKIVYAYFTSGTIVSCNRATVTTLQIAVVVVMGIKTKDFLSIEM